jgi:hypothetical protein
VSTENVLLPLDAERVVSFKQSGRALTFKFRRITDGDWKRYFDAITLRSVSVAGAKKQSRTDEFDYRTARLALVDETLTDVQGYNTADGSPISAMKDWQSRVPYGHKLAASQLLEAVERSSNVDADRQFTILADADEVFLDASWGSATPGEMTRYLGLVHRFKPVTIEQQRKYNRATSRAVVVGGRHGGTTEYAKPHSILASLYDELVLSVDGYGVNGAALDGAENIRREMDTLHKVEAVQQLFATPDAEEPKASE